MNLSKYEFKINAKLGCKVKLKLSYNWTFSVIILLGLIMVVVSSVQTLGDNLGLSNVPGILEISENINVSKEKDKIDVNSTEKVKDHGKIKINNTHGRIEYWELWITLL